MRTRVLIAIVAMLGAGVRAMAPVPSLECAWNPREVHGPSSMVNPVMVYDASRGVTVLFGMTHGGAQADESQTWEWDGSTWTQRAVGGPSPRTGHAMAYDAARRLIVLFGGNVTPNTVGRTEFNDETWEWDGTSWVEREVSGPPARERHSMAYDAARAVTVLVGGDMASYGDPGTGADTWEWDGNAWTAREGGGAPPVNRPPPRGGGSAMAYDADRGVSVLVVGSPAGSRASVKTWEWDGVCWTVPSMNGGPELAGGYAVAYDAVRGATVLFGGLQNFYSNDDRFSGETWEWNGTGWNRLQPGGRGPRPQLHPAMAYDRIRGLTVLLGATAHEEPPIWELEVR